MVNAVIEIAKEVDQEEVEVKVDGDLVTLTNGIVLKTKLVPYKLIIRLDKKYKIPPIPMIYDEERGRSIPNPGDPSYEEECRIIQEEKGTAMLELLTGFGTELVSVPKGVDSPENEGWAEDLAPFLDEDIPEKGKARYVAWLTYYALLDPRDINAVSSSIRDKMGVSAEGVADKVNMFPSD